MFASWVAFNESCGLSGLQCFQPVLALPLQRSVTTLCSSLYWYTEAPSLDDSQLTCLLPPEPLTSLSQFPHRALGGSVDLTGSPLLPVTGAGRMVASWMSINGSDGIASPTAYFLLV